MNVAMERATGLINEGVELLVREGQHSNSTSSFQRALVILKSACRRIDQRATELSLEQSLLSGAKMTSAPTLSAMPTNEAALGICESVLPLPDLQDNQGHYIYNHGICIIRDIPPCTRQAGQDEPVSRLSAIAIFNLALLSHRLAKCGNTRKFQSALTLYAMVLEILSISGSDAADTTFWPTLKLLILNNMAQIHFELLEYAQCHSCLLSVGKILENDVPIHAAFEHVNAEGILLNVMLFNQPSEAGAA